ncbi:AAA family ATPase [Georgenia yuyongxinii]|uniref:AAA family ATPase n=2 Tax=Georgenia yuyongxinii TaxID=2589797 RepID=A0A552WMC0_9MICO|nr:AAA family ATPase [Georgenia yuyongxinii]TRW43906.1 AAA family ATPase [Georgenia yuyongxinii]
MDPLPCRPRRVLVAGVSGAGKTTLARRIGRALAVPHVEIDALFHGPAWTPRPEFLADVERLTATDGWVTEWLYDAARPLLLARADLMVWLDLPAAQTMAQVVTRTVRRRVRGEALWNGNREGPLVTVLRDPEHVVRWAWTTRHRLRDLPATVGAARATAGLPDLPVVRLGSHRAADRWRAGPLISVGRRTEGAAPDISPRS